MVGGSGLGDPPFVFGVESGREGCSELQPPPLPAPATPPTGKAGVQPGAGAASDCFFSLPPQRVEASAAGVTQPHFSVIDL
jgi:hypothetical protein